MLDCQGCGSCVNVCPAKEKALTMVPLDDVREEQKNWDYCLTLSEKKNPMTKFSAKGSQYEQPLYEFSGACPGCGETPYIKLLTQLFGDRMYTANATGCSQAYGFFAPTFPQTVTSRGFGPAFSNSLFENNAEFALGISLSAEQMREQSKMHARNVIEVSADETDAVREALSASKEDSADIDFLRKRQDSLTKKAIWMVGGDGWAYDIGYGGLDHVMATGMDVNVLVLDNELYANTGGQSSKATPIGASVQFAAAGKATPKKDLGLILSSYGYIYVAQVNLGANPEHTISHRLCALHQPRPLQGHVQSDGRGQGGDRVRLLAAVALQPGARRGGKEPLPARLGRAERQAARVHDGRGPLLVPDPDLPRARRTALCRGGGLHRPPLRQVQETGRRISPAKTATPFPGCQGTGFSIRSGLPTPLRQGRAHRAGRCSADAQNTAPRWQGPFS